MRKTLAALMTTATLLYGTVAFAGDPALTCQASKLKTVSKYDACRLKAYSKAAKSASLPEFDRCDLEKFTLAEYRSDGLCTTMGDQAAIQGFADFCTDSVAVALAGGSLPVDCLTCADDLEECNTGLSECEGDLAATNADLGVCNGNLATCTSNLAGCSGNLAACQNNLSATNADLGTCNGSLATCQSTLGTATSGTATVGEVLTGRTFTSSAGIGVTGSMPNNGAVSITPGTASQAIAAGYHSGSGSVSGDADLVAGNIKSGVNLFGVTGTHSSLGGYQKTGQTTCYAAPGGQWQSVSCGGTGQDGEFQKGVAHSFTDNGNGTITDNFTGLMWEKLSYDNSIHDYRTSYSWPAALSTKIATLNVDVHRHSPLAA